MAQARHMHVVFPHPCIKSSSRFLGSKYLAEDELLRSCSRSTKRSMMHECMDVRVLAHSGQGAKQYGGVLLVSETKLVHDMQRESLKSAASNRCETSRDQGMGCGEASTSRYSVGIAQHIVQERVNLQHAINRLSRDLSQPVTCPMARLGRKAKYAGATRLVLDCPCPTLLHHTFRRRRWSRWPSTDSEATLATLQLFIRIDRLHHGHRYLSPSKGSRRLRRVND